MISSPNISVLIPTINESTLDEVVSEAHKQMPSDVEIVIIGFGPAKQTAEKNNVRFFDIGIRTPKPILLNRVINELSSDRFIILDADAIPQSGWAEAMINAFEQGKQLFSASVDVEVGSFWMRVYNLSMLHEFTPEKKPSVRKHLPAISLGFTRETYDRVGPFREDIQRSEDFEWTLRAGKAGIQPWFIPDARVLHQAVAKKTFRSVMQYWWVSGYDSWLVRQMHSDILGTPFWMKSPILILFLSPLLAFVPTLRIMFTSPRLFIKNIALIPFIYLTKLVWCWGLYFEFKKKRSERE